MSYSNLLKSFSVIAISAFVGYSAVKYIQKENSPNRYLASLTMGKMAVEQFSKTVFDVKVKNVEVGLSESDVSIVQVDVEAYTVLPAGLPYLWTIPEDVLIVEGPQQGVFSEFAVNQIQSLTLKIKGYNKTKKSFLSFSINGTLNAAKLQREVLLSSRPEDSFEYIVQNYEKSKEAKAKIKSKLGKSEYKSPIDIKKVIH